MFEARFKLKHRGCWTSGLRRFNSEFVTQFTACTSGKSVQDILGVTLASRSEGVRLLRYLKRSPVVRRVEVIAQDDSSLLLQVFTDTSCIHSVVHAVMDSGCFPSNKIRIVNGFEIWTIAAPKKTALSNALEGVKKLGEFQLLAIKKSSFDGFNLSARQGQVIRHALSSGYFDWPRRASLAEVARAAGVSKATAAEHVRRAEAKILKKAFAL